MRMIISWKRLITFASKSNLPSRTTCAISPKLAPTEKFLPALPITSPRKSPSSTKSIASNRPSITSLPSEFDFERNSYSATPSPRSSRAAPFRSNKVRFGEVLIVGKLIMSAASCSPRYPFPGTYTSFNPLSPL